MGPWRLPASLLALGLLLGACASPQGELGREHRPSGLTAPLPGPDFASYIAAARQHVSESATDADRPLAPEVIEARAPFEIIPDPRRCPRQGGRWPEGVLLIHGLGGTPYEMRDLGRALADACLLVRAILLPGHGTVPGDLLEIQHGAWLKATQKGIESFQDAAETIHLAGFSEGGALALHHALFERPPDGLDLEALVLIAPTLHSRRWSAWLEPATWLAPAQILVDGADPRQDWQAIHPNHDPIRYESMPWNALRQADGLASAVRVRQGSLDRPLFLVLSAEDAGLDAAAARRWFCREVAGHRRLIWYAANATPFSDCRFVTVRESAGDPAILDYAHRALPIAPDNPRYGRTTEAFDCRHYYWDIHSPNWLLCVDRTKTSENSKVRYGEVPPRHLDGVILRRLTYNPDFAQLASDLVGFLNELRSLRNVPIPRLRPAR